MQMRFPRVSMCAPKGEVVSVDIKCSWIMRELGAQRLVSLFDHARSHPELLVNGFKEAGIVDAIEKGEVDLTSQDGSPHLSVREADPFQNIDSD